LIADLEMRQAAAIELDHKEEVRAAMNSQGPIENRPAGWNPAPQRTSHA
jgi:hypothetical protein